MKTLISKGFIITNKLSPVIRSSVRNPKSLKKERQTNKGDATTFSPQTEDEKHPQVLGGPPHPSLPPYQEMGF